MKQRIIEIIKELDEVRVATDLRIGEESLFREACSCYRGEVAGGWKFNKVAQKGSNQAQDTSQSPTEKQIAFLSKNKVAIPKTKKEATQIIKTYIENQKNI